MQTPKIYLFDVQDWLHPTLHTEETAQIYAEMYPDAIYFFDPDDN